MTDDAEKITYKKAIVSFIDILGFRGLVDEHKKNPKFISDILENVESKIYSHYHLDREEEIKKDPDWEGEESFKRRKFYFFSDSVVTVQECSSDMDKIFLLKIMTINKIQSHLVTKGIFIRGGVTYGDIFYEKHRIFGPAMMRAYDLESQYADFPRVIVDERCRGDFDHGIDDCKRYGLLKKDKDGFLCINHFSILASKSKAMIKDGKKRILIRDTIKSKIEKNIKEYKNKERILRKYYWLANEYNNILSKEGSHIDIEKLLTE